MAIRRTFIIAALTLLFASPIALAGAGEYLLTGCQEMYRGDWQSAYDAFTQAATTDGSCREALVGQGAALLQLGDLAGADERFARARVLSPEMASAYAGTAACRHLQGDGFAAMIEYREALSRANSHRAALRASVAWLACRLGLYESALQEATAAVAESPDDSLAQHVYGASLLALGRHTEAVEALGRADPGSLSAEPGVLAAGSALLSPEAAYWTAQGLDDEQRLALAPEHLLTGGSCLAGDEQPTAELPPPISATSDGLRILSPEPNSTVSGVVPLEVEIETAEPIRHIAVLLDNQFMALSNLRPFRTSIDTNRVADGVRELRVEGYTNGGEASVSASMTLRVLNAARTLDPRERSARRIAQEELCSLLSLRATPLTNRQLLGRALEADGRHEEAISAWEYVYAHDPLLPAGRSDLLLGYRNLGLQALGASHEVYVPGEAGAISLTFDDGPHPVMTPWILDLLDRYNYRATFFLVGKQALMYPELVREIVERGHQIGGHSHTHCNLCTLDRLGIEQELVRSRAAIRQACGRTVTLFRPPGGNYNADVRQAAAATGFTSVFWTENIGNYPGMAGPTIADAMNTKLANGGIVLLHNGYDETEVALPYLLEKLKARNARCITIQPGAGEVLGR